MKTIPKGSKKPNRTRSQSTGTGEVQLDGRVARRDVDPALALCRPLAPIDLTLHDAPDLPGHLYGALAALTSWVFNCTVAGPEDWDVEERGAQGEGTFECCGQEHDGWGVAGAHVERER